MKPMETNKTLEASRREKSAAVTANRLVYWLSRNWLLVFGLAWGLLIVLPWLAPVFMKLGWTGAGKVIYLLYALECHQLPERSYFLFGPKMTYSLTEVQAAWQPTNNPLILRQFLGNEQMGWKVAWCERTTWWYGSIWVSALAYRVLRGQLPTFTLRALVLWALPMALDGGTHFISDLTEFGNGFRDNNAWLAALTNHVFSSAFYVGDAFGSFNLWMRMMTGVVLGIAVAWFVFPQAETAMQDMAQRIENKFNQAGLLL
jgi:uncharacterized membrane protein